MNTQSTLANVAELVDALDQLVAVARQFHPEDVLHRLTCSEADALADLFRALGETDLAEGVIQAHASGDVDPEDRHSLAADPERITP